MWITYILQKTPNSEIFYKKKKKVSQSQDEEEEEEEDFNETQI